MARKEADEITLNEMNDKEGTTEGALAVVRGTMELGAVQGEVDESELQLPRLQITYGVGKASANFNQGDLILAGESLIAKKGEPLQIIVLNATTYWKERLTKAGYDAGLFPRSYATEKEVSDVGGITKWSKNPADPKPDFSLALNMKLFIEKPKDLVCAMFGIPVGGKDYAAAVWDVDKTAYKRVAPEIRNASRFSLRTRGLLSGVFTMFTRSEVVGNNPTIVPVMKLTGHNNDEVIEEIKTLFGQGA